MTLQSGPPNGELDLQNETADLMTGTPLDDDQPRTGWRKVVRSPKTYLVLIAFVFVMTLVARLRHPAGPSADGSAPSGGPSEVDFSLYEKGESAFTVYPMEGDMDTVLLEVSDDQLDKMFIVTATFSKADALTTVNHQSANSDANIFAFKKADGGSYGIDLYRPQLDIRVENGSDLEETLRLGAYQGYVRTFPYVVNRDTKGYVFNMQEWIMGLFDIVPYMTDNEAAMRISRVRVFPKNFNVEVEIEILDQGQPVSFSAIEFSIMMLPEDPMPPRFEDERIGYFVAPYISLDDVLDHTTKKRMIYRRQLQKKKGSSARLAKVKSPIIFYLDPSVPEALRPAMKRGIENWRVAFEAAGYEDAISCVVPGDKDFPEDFDASDARFNSISWVPNIEQTYALGPADVDPRTGEVLRSSIIFTHGWVHEWTHKYRMLAHGHVKGYRPSPSAEHQFTSRQAVAHEHLDKLDLTVLRKSGVAPEDIDAFIADGISDVTMHEVGHTLGLRHNFRGSSNYDWNDLKNRSFVEEHGLSSSVMDYTALIVMEDENDQNYYFTPRVGDYDIQAIRYGYSDVDDKELQKIAEETVERGLHFETDDDNPSTSGADPYSSFFDAGGNPMDFHENMVAVSEKQLKNVLEGAKKDDLSWSDYTLEVNYFFRTLSRSAALATKFIGGYSTTRHRSGASTKPIEPIPRELQMRALDFVKRIIDPVDGWLGAKRLNELGPYMVETSGSSCQEVTMQSICLGVTPVDTVRISESFRDDILIQLSGAARMDRLAHSNGLGLAEELQWVTGLFFKSLKDAPAEAEPYVTSARMHWANILLITLRVDSMVEDILAPITRTALCAELGRMRLLAADLIKEETGASKTALVGLRRRLVEYSI